MNKLILTILLCSSCAHVKPCVTVEAPKMTQMECQPVELQTKGYLGLICVEESLQKFGAYLEEAQKWEKDTWASCKEKK